jgi:hypothetical protein
MLASVFRSRSAFKCHPGSGSAFGKRIWIQKALKRAGLLKICSNSVLNSLSLSTLKCHEFLLLIGRAKLFALHRQKNLYHFTCIKCTIVSLWTNFCLLVALKPVTCHQSWVDWLRAMQCWLGAMLHSAESQLSLLCCISLSRLCAMLHSAESKFMSCIFNQSTINMLPFLML